MLLQSTISSLVADFSPYHFCSSIKFSHVLRGCNKRLMTMTGRDHGLKCVNDYLVKPEKLHELVNFFRIEIPG